MNNDERPTTSDERPTTSDERPTTNDQRLSAWLALREAVDHAARSERLTARLAEHLPVDRPLRVLDLGTGRGSNLRYLASRLPGPQEWLAVDRDPELLAELPRVIHQAGVDARVDTRCEDLAALDPTLFAGRHLVTASALLDLVSDSWLHRLAARCHENRSCVLFALTYNGESSCSPAEPEDNEIRDLLNSHQKRDKGFGLAAGPDANRAAVLAFERVGYEVHSELTEWQLSADLSDLQRELVLGWAHAAIELVPERFSMIQDWLARRLAHLHARSSRITVGHYDLAAWPS